MCDICDGVLNGGSRYKLQKIASGIYSNCYKCPCDDNKVIVVTYDYDPWKRFLAELPHPVPGLPIVYDSYMDSDSSVLIMRRYANAQGYASGRRVINAVKRYHVSRDIDDLLEVAAIVSSEAVEPIRNVMWKFVECWNYGDTVIDVHSNNIMVDPVTEEAILLDPICW